MIARNLATFAVLAALATACAFFQPTTEGRNALSAYVQAKAAVAVFVESPAVDADQAADVLAAVELADELALALVAVSGDVPPGDVDSAAQRLVQTVQLACAAAGQAECAVGAALASALLDLGTSPPSGTPDELLAQSAALTDRLRAAVEAKGGGE